MSSEDSDELYSTTCFYTFMLFGRRVATTVSRTDCDITRWIRRIRSAHGRRLRAGHLVAGLGVQWQPGSGLVPAAVVQICVGHSCLVVQLAHCSSVPLALKSFLADARVSFVGVGIGGDVRRLGLWGLRVGNPLEARELAVAEYGGQYSNASMGSLAHLVLGFHGVTKDPWVSRSNWESDVLSTEQVEYACEDAHVAFRLGLRLLHGA